jgi:hypothetical protein
MSPQHGGVECRTRETERQGDRFALGPSQRVARLPQSDPCRKAEDFHAASALNPARSFFVLHDQHGRLVGVVVSLPDRPIAERDHIA